MSTMANNPLGHQAISILSRNREGSYRTQDARGSVLSEVSRVLSQRFGLQKWANLKEKHVNLVVQRWKSEDKGNRTIQGKLAHMRWMLQKIGKPNLLPRSNQELGIPPGARNTRAGKVVSEEKLKEILGRIQDPRVRMMVHLARDLGLRFKEAALFRPGKDWNGDRVWIKRGTKGGRPRYLFPHNARQVEVLRAARALVGKAGGIISKAFRTYEEWRQHVYRILRQAGLGRARDTTFHDLRRTYLVERMAFLMKVRGLSRERAAEIVAREAGHCRMEILRAYLVA